MSMSKIEHVLGMMRVYLVERVTQDGWNEDCARELTQTILTFFSQETVGSASRTSGHGPKLVTEELRRAIRFVNENLDSKLKWDDIAAAVGLDPFTFGRGFKIATGMTPHQYIIRCRLRRAMRLLSKDEMSLADIAFEVGCSCQSHLTTLFRKHLGTTPGAYRALARERSKGSQGAALFLERIVPVRKTGRPAGTPMVPGPIVAQSLQI
jgi:transcriptional regulator GlxA family with amidase domain